MEILGSANDSEVRSNLIANPDVCPAIPLTVEQVKGTAEQQQDARDHVVSVEFESAKVWLNSQ